jgi:transposase
MALREGDRYQHSLLPGCIDDYVGEDDPVRAYDAFVDALDFEEIGLSIDRDKTGNPAYDPRAMLKLLVYGYSYGIRSSRKLERAVYHNLSFIWLVGGLKPDHKTIARFRKENLPVLKQVLKSCARICLKLNLIEGNVLFVDGSKFRGNCGAGKQLTKVRGEKLLKHLDRRIKTLLQECSTIDRAESDLGSSVSMPEELKDAQRLRQKVETCLDELEREERSSINRTDKDAILFSGRQGKHAGYNLQAVVDGTQGLVVSTDAIAESNDRKQLLNQVSQAEETLGKTAQTVCADAGYENIAVQQPLMEQGKKVIVPSQQQASGKELKPFDARRFEYDAEKDCYRCRQGKVLRYSTTDSKTLKRTYRIESKLHCLACCHYGSCTRDKKGRGIKRNPYQAEKAQLEAIYQQSESQEIYRQRKLRAELPFGHIKQNLQANHLLIRGLAGAKAEASLLFSVFNISRMINLLGGVKGFRQAMRTLAV